MNNQQYIQYFPNLYEDEIFYSAIARYHSFTGTNSLKNTLIDVFGTSTVIPTMEFPTNLDFLCKILRQYMDISSDSLIKNHTALPYYSVFNDRKRIGEIEGVMKSGDGKGIKHKIGYIAGSVCQKKGLYYCPSCVNEDVDKFGEAYFHRMHQLQGIFICNRHLRPLLRYPIDYKNISRLQFIRLDKNQIDCNDEITMDATYIEKYKKIADVAEYIITSGLATWDREKVYDKYVRSLEDKGLTTINGQIKQRELFEQFRDYWGEKFLVQLDSNIDPHNEYNWLKVLTRESNRTTHPLRHILFILFLGYNGEDFFVDSKENHGQKLYPCLNPVADHYKEMTIENVTITADYKTRKPVGTFECSCGFVYSRKMESDIYTIGRIKEFGYVWRKKFATVISQNGISLRKTARQMSCDPKTIIKYSAMLSQKEEINVALEYSREPDDCKLLLEEKYIESILKFIEQNPNCTRTEIRNNKTKEYNWLYKNNRKKLDKILPQKYRKKEDEYRRVDWAKRDEEIYSKLKEEYGRIIKDNEKVRITKSLLGKRIGYLSLIEKYLNKLPMSKDFIDSISETIEQYQNRRIIKVADRIEGEGHELRKWKIIREAGLRKPYYQSVLDKIKEIMKSS